MLHTTSTIFCSKPFYFQTKPPLPLPHRLLHTSNGSLVYTQAMNPKTAQMTRVDRESSYRPPFPSYNNTKFMELTYSGNGHLNPKNTSSQLPPAGIERQTFGFDIDDLVQHVDFLNVYSMDYYGPWMSEWGTPTGPIAPLYSGVKGREKFNLDYTMQYYSSQTRQLDKFNIIIPTFVRLWKQVKDAVEPGREVYRNVILKDNMTEGDAYMSRRLAEMEEWKLTPLTWDEQSKSSFIYYPDEGTYLTFETERSLKAKMDYLKEKHFGGVWIWAVDMDDENNTVLNFIRDFGYSTDEI
ncbi:hypothetical protein L5515_010371 [Caenorhabditis briggsae]|uniref:GH18 domain-containing protein n=1 Tax=Caenorhabditis briggsae TaxID=6238 RepID=A0AAE9ELX0_CAEBR|nr:hypothetical protein L5515_010371 [Caenorhabditis briggsae]